MITVEKYLKSPCFYLAIPLWKHYEEKFQNDTIKVLHDKDFSEKYLEEYNDEVYFRLMHTLDFISEDNKEEYIIKTATDEDINLIVDIINKSYSDISVSYQKLMEYKSEKVYDSNLWIIIYKKNGDIPVGCGLADFDQEIAEGILEWIQVLPAYRNQGIGQMIVNELLRRLSQKALFVTVSGKVNDENNPEKLYRKCGFKGEDRWHILRKNREEL